jgi:tight adherence protein B
MIDGAFVGLVGGIGLLLVWWSLWQTGARERTRHGRLAARADRIADDLTTVGLGSLPVAAVPGTGLGLAGAVAVVVWSVSGGVVPALAIGVAAGILPAVLLRGVARRRRTALRELWPEAVDHISSAIRAGLSLPEALAQVGAKGPEALRGPFRTFAQDYQASGDFAVSLDRLKDRLADPVGDRIVEALRITRDVGGTDLGVLMRTLSAFLREDARTRAELEARQSWTVNASYLALAAPWIVLALMCTRPQAAEAYDTPAGIAVILGAAAISLVAHRVMLRIARLPQDERVLR